MIKKLIFVLAVAVSAVACFDDDPNYKTSYTLYATFEYNNVFNSTDSLYFDKVYGTGFGWNNLAFYEKVNGDKTEFLGGFIISRLKGSGDSKENRFRVNSGTGYNASQTYAVYYTDPAATNMPENDIEFLDTKYGTCTMIGCFVNNTKEVVEAVKNSFVEGDRLSVKMTGYLAGAKTGEQEFVLAEFTGQKDSLVTSWSPFKLDKLGVVDIVDIEVMSTRDDIPKAFCMDDMIANIALEY